MNSGDLRTSFANDNGYFEFQSVRAATLYRVSVTAPGFATWTTDAIKLNPGQYFVLSKISVPVAGVEVSVVALTPEQVAREQIREEEKQCVLGFVPNFYVTYERQIESLIEPESVPGSRPVWRDPRFSVKIGGSISPPTLRLGCRSIACADYLSTTLRAKT